MSSFFRIYFTFFCDTQHLVNTIGHNVQRFPCWFFDILSFDFSLIYLTLIVYHKWGVNVKFFLILIQGPQGESRRAPNGQFGRSFTSSSLISLRVVTSLVEFVPVFPVIILCVKPFIGLYRLPWHYLLGAFLYGFGLITFLVSPPWPNCVEYFRYLRNCSSTFQEFVYGFCSHVHNHFLHDMVNCRVHTIRPILIF